jgi:hypothetical protein
MKGPAPKNPSVRARTNRAATQSILRAVKNPKIPPLPDGTDWSVAVQDWWRRAWSSPMCEEWTESDVDALYVAASLMQAFWDPDTSLTFRIRAASEVRQVLGECGLTPMARRRLQWQIEQGEEAAVRTSARRAARKPRVAAAADVRERRRGA